MDDASLRNLFHGALDEVVPAKPWLVSAVREEVRRRQPELRLRRRLQIWTPALRRAIAAILIVAIAAGAAAATIAIYEQHRNTLPVIPAPGGPVTRACATSGIHMADPKNGWNGTNRTDDGGKTWRDVSPPPVNDFVKGPSSSCALNNLDAWTLASTGTVPYQPTLLVVTATHDGGGSWSQVGSVQVPFDVSWRTNFAADLDFLDKSHGWLWMQYSTTPQQRIVYATTDGGTTWARVSALPDLGLKNAAFDCSETGLMFNTVQRGWLTWDCSSGFGETPMTGTPVMATTDDGGHTWSTVTLDEMPTSKDAICGATSPVFTSDHGMFELSCSGASRPARDFVYSTGNGGKTWTPHALSARATVDFVTGTTAFYLVRAAEGAPTGLYRTNDGGAHWVVVTKNVLPGRDVSGLTFLSDTVGFVTASDSPAPWWTYDGGKTWQLLPPYRSAAGGTVCGVFDDPGSAWRLPRSVQMMSPTVGWAPGTRRTVDGGAHWTKVAPPVPQYRGVGYSEFFLDANHAWVVDTAGTKTECADHVVTYATSDGGATWQQLSTTPIPLNAADRLAGSWNVGIEFVDPQHGWLTAHSVSAHLVATPVSQPVYRTSDGGRTWTLISSAATWSAGDCASEGLPTFTSPMNGWIGAACSGPAQSSWNLLVTQDGGDSWTDVEVKKNACSDPGGCGLPTPSAVDATHGWTIDADSGTLWTTSDGGLHWASLGLPRGHLTMCPGKGAPTPCFSKYVVNGTFLTASEGWIITLDLTPNGPSAVHVERTLDGGRTWSTVYTKKLTSPTDFTGSLTFVDANHGFWFLDSDSTLHATSDGGRTWHQLQMTYS